MFLSRLSVTVTLVKQNSKILISQVTSFHTSPAYQDWNVYHLFKPKAWEKGGYRRQVLFPDKYTVAPLPVKNLAGRDPNTGRVLTSHWGGGIKFPSHWIVYKREGPSVEGEYLVESVIQIMKCGCRTAHIALIGSGSHLRYILATKNMKAGDTIRTSQFIPHAPVLAFEGDAFPLGALPPGTLVHCISKLPGEPGSLVRAAGTAATILRKVNDRVVVKMPSKLEISFPEACMATVGQLSNVEHQNEEWGSAMKWRQSGRRPVSGLWHRKDGRFGRKIKPPPPVFIMKPDEKPEFEYRQFTTPHLNIVFPPGMVKEFK